MASYTSGDGLPRWMMSRTFVLTATLLTLIISRFFGFPGSLLATEVVTDLPCFQLSRKSAFVSRNLPFTDRERLFFAKKKRIDQKMMKVISAARSCPIDHCEGTARKAYQKAVRNYILDRADDTHAFELFYGEPGLRMIQQAYSGFSHVVIVEELRERLKRGQVEIYRVKDFMRVLLSYPPEDVRACRVEDVS